MDTKTRETAIPDPYDLVQSISEQGYSLETSLADLIDNSISANASAVELLVDFETEPFALFLADDGDGMDESALRSAMRFPSSSPRKDRHKSDLGRFGLGMKTASFSQTRSFTVISRPKGCSGEYVGRTWDVELLADGEWEVIVNSQEDISKMLTAYSSLSKRKLSRMDGFHPNTIIVWRGLYKFENYLSESNRKSALKKEITKITSEHLSLVFHRFLGRSERRLRIRVNNDLLHPFDPFPPGDAGVRLVEAGYRSFSGDEIRMEGYVLPARSIEESKEKSNVWTPPGKSLTDMEGLYVYRQDRIISFGGWNGIIRKAQRLQLARMKVEIGNNIDHLLHLNVAKSKVIIPHDLQDAFAKYVIELKTQAEREFYNRTINEFSKNKVRGEQLFHSVSTNKGAVLKFNDSYPILDNLKRGLNKKQVASLQVFLRTIETSINKIRRNHDDQASMQLESDELSSDQLISVVTELLELGTAPSLIRDVIIPELGYEVDAIPEAVWNLLERHK